MIKELTMKIFKLLVSTALVASTTPALISPTLANVISAATSMKPAAA